MASPFDREVYCLLGLPFDAIDVAGTIRCIRDSIVSRAPCFLSTANLNWLVASLNDHALRNSVINSHLSVADGMPIIWIAKLLCIPIHERVAGSTVFEIMRRDLATKTSIYLFGGPKGIAEAACRRLNAEARGMVCAGFECPGFGSVEAMSSEEIIDRINASAADFVLVALGAKKGQAWIERNRSRLSAPVISHLGAVINFVAGTVNRAPAWMQRMGLEWFWRIIEEPSLWHRYLSDGLVFLRLLVAQVAPYAWFLLTNRPDPHEIGSATIEVRDEGSEILVRLRGAWIRENLTPLRDCFNRTSLLDRNVCLDMKSVSYVDSAFLGLTIMLYGQQMKRGKRLIMKSLQEPVRRIIRYCCADYLILPVKK